MNRHESSVQKRAALEQQSLRIRKFIAQSDELLARGSIRANHSYKQQRNAAGSGREGDTDLGRGAGSGTGVVVDIAEGQAVRERGGGGGAWR
jgi:hypothetical protein